MAKRRLADLVSPDLSRLPGSEEVTKAVNQSMVDSMTPEEKAVHQGGVNQQVVQPQMQQTPSVAPSPTIQQTGALSASQMGGNEALERGAKASQVASELVGQTETAPQTSQPQVTDAGEIADLWMQRAVDRGLVQKPETPEEMAEREKREKRNRWINGISDAVSAAANLVATNYGGINVFEPSNSLSVNAAREQERQRLLREQNRRLYLNQYDNYMKMAEDRLNKDREYGRQMRKDAWERQRDTYKMQLDAALKNAQITKAQYDAMKSQLEAENLPNKQKWDAELAKARVASAKASAANSYASAKNKKEELSFKKAEANRKAAQEEAKDTVMYTGADGKQRRYTKRDNGEGYLQSAFAQAKNDNPEMWNEFQKELFQEGGGNGIIGSGSSRTTKRNITNDEIKRFIAQVSLANEMAKAEAGDDNNMPGVQTGDSDKMPGVQ